MKIDFRAALARLVPLFMPELLFRLGADGKPLFKEFADAIVPTQFLPGQVFGNGTMLPIDYCVAMAEGRIEPPQNSTSPRFSNKSWQTLLGSIFLNIWRGVRVIGKPKASLKVSLIGMP